MRRVLIIATAAMLCLAACSGSSKKADPAADMELAKSAVLTQADVGDGYDGSPHEESDDDDLPQDARNAFQQCVDVEGDVFADDGKSPKANSEDFSSGDGMSIENEITIGEDDSDHDDEFEALTADNTADCLEELFRAALESTKPDDTEATIGKVSVAKINVPDLGDRAVGYRIKAPISLAQGGDVTFYSDLYAAQVDRFVAQVETSSTNEPFDEATAADLLKTVVERLEKDD